jgi:hypothetical protein
MARESGIQSRRKVRDEAMRKDFPVYPDAILRELLGPLPPNPSGKGPELRDKSGRLIRAMMADGGEVKRYKNGGCVMRGRGTKFRGVK